MHFDRRGCACLRGCKPRFPWRPPRRCPAHPPQCRPERPRSSPRRRARCQASPLRSRSQARMLCSSALETYSVRPLGESAMPRGRAGGFRHQRHRAFGRDVIHAMEIEFAVVALLAERRVGEVDVAVARHHDLRRRIELLAFPVVGQHFDLAVLFGAGHAPRARFARVQPALGVEGIARGAVRIGAVDLDLVARNPFQKPVARRIAEDQVAAFLRPGRTLR